MTDDRPSSVSQPRGRRYAYTGALRAYGGPISVFVAGLPPATTMTSAPCS